MVIAGDGISQAVAERSAVRARDRKAGTTTPHGLTSTRSDRTPATSNWVAYPTLRRHAVPSADTTRLLKKWSAGDDSAFDELFPRVYEELKAIAHHRLVSGPGEPAVATTVLVHEAYLKLVDSDHARVGDRAHFLAIASRAMRFILVDQARARMAKKRGGPEPLVPLDEVEVASVEHAAEEIITLNDALERLATFDERLGRVVEYRFFGGMEYEEIADATGRSVPTVKRDWARARAWLYDFMSDGSGENAE